MECLICLDDIKENELYKSECGHHFHHKCITFEFAEQCNTFFIKNLSCPYCRNILKDSEATRKKDMITNIHGVPENIKIVKGWGFLNVPYNNQNCCVLTTSGNQCKKKILNNENNTSEITKNMDEQSLMYLNSFKFITHNLCSYHSKNFNKIKRFHHPYFNWILLITH